MSSYSGKDRILKGWKGEGAERVSFNVDIGPHYTAAMNLTPNDYFGNLETAIDVQVKSVEAYASDIITVPQNFMAWFATNLCYRYKDRPDPVQDNAIKKMEDLEGMEPVPVQEIEGLGLLKGSCAKISELAPDHASRTAVMGPIIDAVRMAGLEDFIAATVENPEFAHKLMSIATEGATARALDIVKNADVLVLLVAETFASISNLSPKIYREFVFPYEQKMFQAMQDASAGSKIIGVHICGFIDPIMEDVAALPLDWIELDAPSSLEKLFEANKGKMMIRGNVGGELFSEGTRDQIFDAVKACLDVAARDPKYILSTGCQIPLNAPLEQVQNFIDAALELGSYH